MLDIFSRALVKSIFLAACFIVTFYVAAYFDPSAYGVDILVSVAYVFFGFSPSIIGISIITLLLVEYLNRNKVNISKKEESVGYFLILSLFLCALFALNVFKSLGLIVELAWLLVVIYFAERLLPNRFGKSEWRTFLCYAALFPILFFVYFLLGIDTFF